MLSALAGCLAQKTMRGAFFGGGGGALGKGAKYAWENPDLELNEWAWGDVLEDMAAEAPWAAIGGAFLEGLAAIPECSEVAVAAIKPK